MGYPENALARDEKLVLHKHPHWKALIVPAFLFIVVSGVAAFIGAVVSGAGSWSEGTKTVVGIIVGVIWAIIVVWWSIRPFLSWWTTHFVITDRRVTFRNGILTRSGIDIPVARINSVQFRHGFVDRILRTGTLIIESASDDPLEFDDIPQVEKVHAMLYHEVFDSLDSEESGNGPARRHSSGEPYSSDTFRGDGR